MKILVTGFESYNENVITRIAMKNPRSPVNSLFFIISTSFMVGIEVFYHILHLLSTEKEAVTFGKTETN